MPDGTRRDDEPAGVTVPVGPGTVIAGRYRIDDLVGRGGAGAVWRATDTLLGRRVALKVLHPELESDRATRQRFRREAVAAAALNHPHAAAIYDIAADGARPFLVMELVDGPSVADLLEEGPLDPVRTATIGYQVATALGVAHDRGLIHRDVKPANVLVTRDGLAKVVDFGIAKAVHETRSGLTSIGTVLGTAAYVAPEQLREQPADARTDVYALGLVLHECLTGERPFRGETPAAVAAARLQREPDDLTASRPDLPTSLTEAIRRATRTDPALRFPDGRAFAGALAGLVGKHTPSPADATRDAAVTVPLRFDALPDPAGPDTVPDAARPDTLADATTPMRADDGGAGTGGGDERNARRHHDRTEDLPLEDLGADGPADGAEGDDAADARSTGRSWGRTALVLGALALFVIVGALAAPFDDDPGGGGGGGGGDVERLPVASVRSVDPLGDGSEHDELTASAVDGNADTAWRTDRYNTRDFGGLKAGVGLAFDLGEAREVTAVALDLAQPGTGVEVYALEGPTDAGPTAWGEPLVDRERIPARVRLDVRGTEARHWVVWFTRLPESRRIDLAEVRFLGP